MDDICAYSNYQLHTCGSHICFSEYYLRGITQCRMHFHLRGALIDSHSHFKCNTHRHSHIMIRCVVDAIIICASVWIFEENDWKTPWQQPGNGTQSICFKLSFMIVFISYPPLFLSAFPPASFIYSLPIFWFMVPRFGHISLCPVLTSVNISGV